MDNKIYINYGKDIAEMTYQMMSKANIQKDFVSDMNVVLKPNLVVAKDASYGATTHPEIIEGIINFLIDNNVKNITIAEGSWVGVKRTYVAYKKCGYEDLVKRYKNCNIKLIDTKEDEVSYINVKGELLGVCKSLYNADYIINIPVLKGHCQTKLTCCLKNMKGCIPDSEKRRYHSMGLTKPIAMLNCVLKPNLHIVDSICGDLDFEEGGNPVQADRLLLGRDPVLLDSYGAALLGYRPEKIGYLALSRDYKIGRFFDNNTEIIEMNKQNKPAHKKSTGARKLDSKIDESAACSACYANLIYALDKTNLNPINQKIKIGQGFKGVKCDAVGIGNCTSGCKKNIKGCPPAAIDIIEFLKEVYKN